MMSVAQHGYVHPSSTDQGATDETDEVNLQVLCLTGEGVPLSVPRSMLGYDMRKLMSEKLPCKPGAKLAVHHMNRTPNLWSNLGRARDCCQIGNAVLHLHTNECVHCVELCLWPPNLWERFCARRRYTTWGRHAWRVFTSSPRQPRKLEFWRWL